MMFLALLSIDVESSVTHQFEYVFTKNFKTLIFIQLIFFNHSVCIDVRAKTFASSQVLDDEEKMNVSLDKSYLLWAQLGNF